MKRFFQGGFMVLCLSLLATSVWAQQATLQGRVSDENGDGIPSATVALYDQGAGNLVTGTSTALDGSYSVRAAAGSYELRVSFIGFDTFSTVVNLSAGGTTSQNVTLIEAGINLNPVVVTASRQQEQTLDAPASVDVLEAREVKQQATTSTAATLRNVTGVDLARTGVDRYEIVLRGFNNAFSGATHVLVDYREGAAASLGVNMYSAMPISNDDMDRIEVVRGPGSALYGPGVDAGVVHFFTRSPLTSPGTTLTLTGGERGTLGANLRFAGASSNFGYKITGSYLQADEWELDPSDPHDAAQLNSEVRAREYDAKKNSVGLTLQYQLNDKANITFNGGRAATWSNSLSGIGTVQARNFGYTYGQLRFTSGGFFAQTYLNKNDAGDSFVYDSGLSVVDNSTQFNVQAQYDFDLSDDFQVIVGADFERTTPDTEGTIYGRNENDDTLEEIGGYIQTSLALGDKLNLTLAVRGDNSNIFDFEISPRAALVFKPSPGQSLRATYNRAFSSPGNNSLFLDIIAGRNGPVTFRGRGAREGYTFQHNPAFTAIAGNDLVASSLLPGQEGQPTPTALSLGALYGSIYQTLAGFPLPNLQAVLAANGVNVDLATLGQLVALLSPTEVVMGLPTTNVAGFSQGILGMVNLSTGGIDPVSGVNDVVPLQQTTTETYEIGYKGIINDRVLLAIDGYYTKKENFTGPLNPETPFVLVPNAIGDFTAALAAGISGNAVLNGALGGLGLNAAAVAALITSIADTPATPGGTGLLTQLANSPIAIVQPAENNTPGEVMLTYRNFGQIDFWGVDVAVQVLASDNLSFQTNISYISDNFFDADEVGEPGTGLSVALNAPQFKLKLGADYRQPGGISFNIAGRYNDGFPVQSGPYVGDIDNYFLVDLGLGYDLSSWLSGLRVDVLAENVLNNEHREFIGAPQIGRMALAKVTFDF